ncbi:MAG: rhomboid family intramembrane serine protease [Deltaproteobacteria bacterium]|nr:rhomboid family intramembrane serine protease [Deltaproteobacteria bacterium]
MLELYDRLSKESADICGLVLTSSGLSFKSRKGLAGWSIWVDERHYPDARRVIARYFEENRWSPPLPEDVPVSKTRSSYAGVWAALLLAVFYFFTSGTLDGQTVWAAFGASAEKIMSGEIFRTVTALMLHADMAHLTGNMAGMALFGSAVCSVAGWGVGSLMILFSGALGNLANALVYQNGHLSIGASTAVFGAVGFLSGCQFIRKRQAGVRRFAAWLPIAGGLALLAMLGAGLHVDITAHFFGFFSGIILGVLFAVLAVRPPNTHIQAACLAICIFLIFFSWGWGLF